MDRTKLLFTLTFLFSINFSYSQCSYSIDSSFGDFPYGSKFLDTSLISKLYYSTFIRSSDLNYYLIGQYVRNSKLSGAIIKLNSSGEVDKSFGSNGKIYIDTTFSGNLNYGTELSNNELLVCGHRSTEVYVAKYDLSGSLIKGFASNGVFADKKAFSQGEADGLKLDSKNNIYVAGHVNSRNIGPFVLKLNQNGKLDSSFGTNGYYRLITPIETFETGVHIELIPDGIIFGYSTGSLNLSEVIISKLNLSGKLDSTFGVNGSFKLPTLGRMYLRKINFQNGNINLYGSCYNNNKNLAYVAQVTLGGKLNTNFDPFGYKLYSSYLPNTFIECDDNFILSSTEIVNSKLFASLRSINSITGKVDSTFGINGILNIALDSSLNQPFLIRDIFKKDNSILILGTNSDQYLVMAKVKQVGTSGYINLSTSTSLIYPNPCHDEIKIKPNVDSKIIDIEVYKVNSELIERVTLHSKNEFVLNCSHWDSGMYYIKLRYLDKFEVVKMIKN